MLAMEAISLSAGERQAVKLWGSPDTNKNTLSKGRSWGKIAGNGTS
jgi:hypothetical protein